jgi:hypothetical protein
MVLLIQPKHLSKKAIKNLRKQYNELYKGKKPYIKILKEK